MLLISKIAITDMNFLMSKIVPSWFLLGTLRVSQKALVRVSAPAHHEVGLGVGALPGGALCGRQSFCSVWHTEHSCGILRCSLSLLKSWQTHK